MSIKTPEELAGMKAAGRIVRRMLEAMKSVVRSGITTGELDEVGAPLCANMERVQPLPWSMDFRA